MHPATLEGPVDGMDGALCYCHCSKEFLVLNVLACWRASVAFRLKGACS
jgi:hypothetical protein